VHREQRLNTYLGRSIYSMHLSKTLLNLRLNQNSGGVIHEKD